MRSSYINKDLSYGNLLETIAFTKNPNNILEVGILDGYSITKFLNGCKNTKIDAFDLFNEFNGNCSNKNYLINKFKDYDNVTINYGDFYNLCITEKYDIIHIDIANNGNIYEFAIKNYISKLNKNGILILEGGSEDRDNINWMNKLKKPKIQPIIEKFSKDYNIKTLGSIPSITLISQF